MAKKIVLYIANILNMDNPLQEKQMLLKHALKHRRLISKQILSIVANLLSEYILPFKIEGHFHLALIDEVSEETYTLLNDLLKKSHCYYFNAVCGELLWNHYHEAHFARVSLQSYYYALDISHFNSQHEFTQKMISICRIYSKYQDSQFAYDEFFNKCIIYVNQSVISTNSFLSLYVLQALFSCNQYLDRIELAAIDAVAHYETKENYRLAIAFEEFLEKLYSSEERKTDAQEALKRIARLYEKDAAQLNWSDPKSASRIIQLIQHAMNIWQRIGDKESRLERKRLAKKIAPVKRNSLQAMVPVPGEPLDLTSFMQEAKTVIDKSTFEQAIYNFINLLDLQKPDFSYEQLSDSVTSNLFPLAYLDQNGRNRFIVPPAIGASPDEKLAIIENKTAELYRMVAQAHLIRFLHLMREKYQFTEENLAFIVDQNAFIPPDRKTSFLKGLVAGFNLDYITSLSILLPQVENALRVLAEECGAIVYKTNIDGTEECLSMESVLKQPEIEECLDNTLLFNLRLFYTSKYGFGMRNLISHGLEPDNDIQSASGLAVWWFTLHLCCNYSRHLIKALLDQQNGEANED